MIKVLNNKQIFNTHKNSNLTILLILFIINLKKEVIIKNISYTKEIETLLKIIKRIGGSIDIKGKLISIDCNNIYNNELGLKLVNKRAITIYLLPLITNVFGFANIPLDKDKIIYPITHVTSIMEYFGITSNFDNKRIISQKIKDVNNVIININDLKTEKRYLEEATITAILLGCKIKTTIINPLITKETKKVIKILKELEIDIKVNKNGINLN